MVWDNNLHNVNTIIAGDLNICTLKNLTHGPTTNFINTMHANHFYPLITKATRITDNSQSLIDHIWCNHISTFHSGIFEVDITDHYPVFVCYPMLVKTENKLIEVKFRDMTSKNTDKFKQLIGHVAGRK